LILLPYKIDSNINRIPIFTLIISIICILVFISQHFKDSRHYQAINNFCHESLERGDLILLRHIANTESGNQCGYIFESIREAPNPTEKIIELAKRAKPIGAFATEEDDFTYRYSRLNTLYDQYDLVVPKSLTDQLAYNPNEINLVKMATSTFSHADITHLAGNLLFFYIFSSSVELVLGSLVYLGFIFIATIGTSLAYSYAMIGVDEALPTIGLSGIVMATVAALGTMLPSARIRCVFWFLFYIKVFRIPAFLLAAWYIGWDIYEMTTLGNDSYINYTAHVSGAVIGGCFGAYYFLFRKHMVYALLDN
jgi:membrane associated rhomboid family serine protease